MKVYVYTTELRWYDGPDDPKSMFKQVPRLITTIEGIYENKADAMIIAQDDILKRNDHIPEAQIYGEGYFWTVYDSQGRPEIIYTVSDYELQ